MLFQAILGSLNWKIFCCPTMVANIYNKFYDFHSEKSYVIFEKLYTSNPGIITLLIFYSKIMQKRCTKN